MDSLTQIVLGAAVGEAILGRQLGNKAILFGAIAGTIPDLDVVYSLFDSDPVQHIVVHRSYSHSMFTHILLALPLAWLSVRWSKKPITFGKWYWFWFAGLFTHALLDCCTTYGTRLFLPFTDYQVAFNNISVVDPLYTLPFMVLLGVCLFIKRDMPRRRKFLLASLTVSSAYMLATFGLKYSVHQKFTGSLQKENIAYDCLSTNPTILNAVLWSAVAYNDSTLWCADYSFLKPDRPMKWVAYSRNLESKKNFESEALHVMEWFSDGKYFVEPQGADTLAFYNAKWGQIRFDVTSPKEAFIFSMLFYKQNGEIKYEEVFSRDWKPKEALKMLRERIGI